MNDNDYDNDGNNIVPCPICMSSHCPSKEDGKCPEEDMFALEGEIRLLLDEYKATDDNSRIANVLEAVEHRLTQYHQDLIDEVVENLEGMKTDERKVATFGEWQAETYEDKMLVNAVLTEAQTIIKSK